MQLAGRDEVLRNRKGGIHPSFFLYVQVAARACELPLSELTFPDRKIIVEAVRDIRAVGAALREMSDICDAGCDRLIAAVLDGDDAT